MARLCKKVLGVVTLATVFSAWSCASNDRNQSAVADASGFGGASTGSAGSDAAGDGAAGQGGAAAGSANIDASNASGGNAGGAGADSPSEAADANIADVAADTSNTSNDAAAPSNCDAARFLAPTTLAVRFADTVLKTWPDPQQISGLMPAWEYNAGIVLHGITRVYRATSDPRYLAYVRRWVDGFVDAAGTVNMPAMHSFDTIQPAILLTFLWQESRATKYQLAAQNIRARFDSIPRNAEGGYWHKQIYTNQMWLDGIYMGQPFLVRFGSLFSCGTFCNDTAATQALLIAQHVRDPGTGLLYHAWDDSLTATWAAPVTGRSPVIWSRGLGWYAMALVDILGDLPGDHPRRADLLGVLSSLAAGLKATQDARTGLWYQVVDQGNSSDNWLETSGSGMFVYALKVASDRGYIDSTYLTVAARGWQGLKGQVTTDTSGSPVINGAVQGMGVQDNYANYVNQVRLSNSPHGICAMLLAASEMEASCP